MPVKSQSQYARKTLLCFHNNKANMVSSCHICAIVTGCFANESVYLGCFQVFLNSIFQSERLGGR